MRKRGGRRSRMRVASHTKTIADMLKYQSTFCYSSAGALSCRRGRRAWQVPEAGEGQEQLRELV